MIDCHDLSSVKSEPWKNGNGSTRTLASEPGFRVSLAEVACDTAFSIFESTRRHSVVVHGGPVQLRHRTAILDLLKGCVTSYNGALQWDCTLLGPPARVFNVMREASNAALSIEVLRENFSARQIHRGAILLPVNCDLVCETAGARLTRINEGQFAVFSDAGFVSGTLDHDVAQQDAFVVMAIP